MPVAVPCAMERRCPAAAEQGALVWCFDEADGLSVEYPFERSAATPARPSAIRPSMQYSELRPRFAVRRPAVPPLSTVNGLAT